jgi:Sec-independent protein translocase protein TatA
VERSRWALILGIVEIIVILVVALIVIPPENLPDVMRATGKVLRELRLASNMVMREIGGALDQPPPPRDVPPINTMKPSIKATAANIAQPAVSTEADLATAPAESATPADSPASIVKPGLDSADGSVKPAADSPESIAKPADASATPITHS